MFFPGSSDIRIRNKQTTSPRLGGSWLSWFLGYGHPWVLPLVLGSLPLGSIEWPKVTGFRGLTSSFTVTPIPFMRVGYPLLKNAGSPWEMQRCSRQEKTGDSTPPFRPLVDSSSLPSALWRYHPTASLYNCQWEICRQSSRLMVRLCFPFVYFKMIFLFVPAVLNIQWLRCH